MTQHDFETSLESLYAQPTKFEDEQEFASRLTRRFDRSHVLRIALLWMFGALGAFLSCYWIGFDNLLTLLSEACDFLFTAVDGLAFYVFASIALLVTAALHRDRTSG